ncbi:MAG: YggS family pyridoxal phosphate-dependent enzyme [Epsilonproteobacteria bacterium]|nr:YggS family pyridoxal phosphate-dependent enzyme [Campylobacterota bacterium]
MHQYEKNFDSVLTRIEQVRLETNEHQIIKIIAASKYVETPEIEDFYRVGQRAFGENRIQDMKAKADALEDYPIEWHFIGRLQSNKINALLDLSPALIHSCESFEMAQEIDKRALVKGIKPNILLQINSAAEATKAGISPDEAIESYLKITETLQNVRLKGVMSIGAHSEDQKEIQKSFESTYNIYEALQKHGAKYCSMGMSNDFELAVACGSNMLRLGSILFK